MKKLLGILVLGLLFSSNAYAKELLLKWKDLMLKHNPDYITGYNIFGFDFDYIIKRVEKIFKCTHKNCKYNSVS